MFLCSECVTWSDTQQQGSQELNFREKGLGGIKLGIAAGRNTHCTLYWYSEVNTDLHNGDVIVRTFKLFMYDYPLSTMNRSTRIGVSGARPHSDIFKIIPVESKIFLFMLSIQLMVGYIINSIGGLALSILYDYKHSVINDA